MSKIKKSALFSAALVIPAAIAGYFTILYQMDFMAPELLAPTVELLGGRHMLILIYIVQTVGYALVCGFFGSWMAQILGIFPPIKFCKPALKKTLALSFLFGILFSLDYWTFGAAIPEIQEGTAATLHPIVLVSSVLYGGIVEEVMLRLFMMSLIALVLWKVFFRKSETAPIGVIIAANIIASVLFAAGHLPATVMVFGELTPLILFRCFLLNGGFGLLFGWLYRKYGIQYSMLSHATLHIISKLIWALSI